MFYVETDKGDNATAETFAAARLAAETMIHDDPRADTATIAKGMLYGDPWIEGVATVERNTGAFGPAWVTRFTDADTRHHGGSEER